MGNCNRPQLDPAEEYENARVELLKMLKLNLNLIEENTQKVKKEDVHYKMKKFIFWLNLLQQINPYIKILEDEKTNKNLDLEKIKNVFDEIFGNLWTNDRNKFYSQISNLKDSFTPKRNPTDLENEQLERERLSQLIQKKTQINSNSTPR